MEKKCQKCFGKMTCSYHQDGQECRCGGEIRKSEPKEHLHWVCQECGYDCTTAPLDDDSVPVKVIVDGAEYTGAKEAAQALKQLKEEKAEWYRRRDRFLKSLDFDKLTQAEADLLREQWSLMGLYSAVLGKRIRLLESTDLSGLAKQQAEAKAGGFRADKAEDLNQLAAGWETWRIGGRKEGDRRDAAECDHSAAGPKDSFCPKCLHHIG